MGGANAGETDRGRRAYAAARRSRRCSTAAQIKFMTLNLDYSIAKAKRVLGYRAAGRFSRRDPDRAR